MVVVVVPFLKPESGASYGGMEFVGYLLVVVVDPDDTYHGQTRQQTHEPVSSGKPLLSPPSLHKRSARAAGRRVPLPVVVVVVMASAAADFRSRSTRTERSRFEGAAGRCCS